MAVVLVGDAGIFLLACEVFDDEGQDKEGRAKGDRENAGDHLPVGELPVAEDRNGERSGDKEEVAQNEGPLRERQLGNIIGMFAKHWDGLNYGLGCGVCNVFSH
jgi:hypothetical protein